MIVKSKEVFIVVVGGPGGFPDHLDVFKTLEDANNFVDISTRRGQTTAVYEGKLWEKQEQEDQQTEKYLVGQIWNYRCPYCNLPFSEIEQTKRLPHEKSIEFLITFTCGTIIKERRSFGGGFSCYPVSYGPPCVDVIQGVIRGKPQEALPVSYEGDYHERR